jgi:pyruvate carboxylase
MNKARKLTPAGEELKEKLRRMMRQAVKDVAMYKTFDSKKFATDFILSEPDLVMVKHFVRGSNELKSLSYITVNNENYYPIIPLVEKE